MKVLVFIAVAAFICQASCMSFGREDSKQDPGDIICDDCKVLFTDIKDIIQSDELKNATIAGATHFLCGNESDTSLYHFCQSLVNSLISPILQVMSKELEPEGACFFFSLCQPEGIHQDFTYDMRLFHHFVKKVKKEIKNELKKYRHH